VYAQEARRAVSKQSLCDETRRFSMLAGLQISHTMAWESAMYNIKYKVYKNEKTLTDKNLCYQNLILLSLHLEHMLESIDRPKDGMNSLREAVSLSNAR